MTNAEKHIIKAKLRCIMNSSDGDDAAKESSLCNQALLFIDELEGQYEELKAVATDPDMSIENVYEVIQRHEAQNG